VTDLIGQAFNAWYDPDHVWKILHALG